MNKLKFWGLVVVVFVPMVLISYKYFLTVSTIDVRVADINKGEFVSLCLVDVEDKGAACDEYTNVDDMWFLKRDSGKVRSRLAIAEQDKEVLKLKVQGIRFTWLSWRKNIISVQ